MGATNFKCSKRLVYLHKLVVIGKLQETNKGFLGSTILQTVLMKQQIDKQIGSAVIVTIAMKLDTESISAYTVTKRVTAAQLTCTMLAM